MIEDSRTQFAAALALSTGGTGLAFIGDVIDLQSGGGAAAIGVGAGTYNARDIGDAKQLYLVIQIQTSVTSGGAASVSFSLVSDAQAAIAADGSATVHATTASIAKATLIAGYTFIVPVPPQGSVVYERYLGILQNVVTTVLTAGKINAFLTFNPKSWKAYPDAI